MSIRRCKVTAWGLTAAVALLGTAGVRSAAPVSGSPRASAESVYAAFTINLTRFITWPESDLGPKGAPFLIGTFARDPINQELDLAVAGEEVDGHPVRTIRLRDVNDVSRCQVVFVSRGAANTRAVLEQAAHRPILTVSDAPAFLAEGGHVRFVADPPHTRLEISAVNLRASGLQARAQLLRVANTP